MLVKIIKLRALQLHNFAQKYVCVMYAIYQIPFKEGSQKSKAPSHSFYLDLPFRLTLQSKMGVGSGNNK